MITDRSSSKITEQIPATPTPKGTAACGKSAAEIIEERSRECLAKADPALDALIAMTPRYLKSPDHVKELEKTKHAMRTEMFKLMVVGCFSTGKSTFVNALLGRPARSVNGLEAGQAPIPMHDLPTTAILTSIEYAETPEVQVLFKEEYHKSHGESEKWPFEKYLKDAKIKPTEDQNRAFFGPIREFRMAFPAELCRAGITLYDSPGANDEPGRDEITLNAAANVDACIVMFRSDMLASMSDRELVKALSVIGISTTFFVVNMWNKRAIDQEFKTVVWERLVKKIKGGNSYAGEDFADERIFFVDAQSALEGKMTNRPDLVASSGMADFEDHLRRFLETEKRSAHMERFVNKAKYYVATLDREITRLNSALKLDYQKTKTQFDQSRPKLDEIIARGALVPKIVTAGKEKTKRDVEISLDSFANRLVAGLVEGGDLYDEIMAVQIPSLHKSGFGANLAMRFKAPFQRKALSEEAAEIVQGLIETRVKAWQDSKDPVTGLQGIVTARVCDTMQEIEAAVTRIDREFESFEHDLTGYTSMDRGNMDIVKPSISGRVVGVGWGLLTGQPDMIFSAGTGGWSGLGRDMLGRAMMATLLLLLGTPFAVTIPIVALAGFLLNLIWGTGALEAQLLKGIIQCLREGNPKDNHAGKLSDIIRASKENLCDAVGTFFDKLSNAMNKEVKDAMSDQVDSLKRQLDLCMQDASAKQTQLNNMEMDAKQLTNASRLLDEALCQAKQL